MLPHWVSKPHLTVWYSKLLEVHFNSIPAGSKISKKLLIRIFYECLNLNEASVPIVVMLLKVTPPTFLLDALTGKWT